MKRLMCLICLLALPLAASAESAPEKTAEAAAPLIAALVRCPSLASFEDTPSDELCFEAARSLSELIKRDAPVNGLTALLPEDTGALMFVSASYPENAPEETSGLIDAIYETDSAIDCGNGEIKVSVVVYADFGEGYEFWLAADIYLLPDAKSPFSAGISRVFIPE